MIRRNGTAGYLRFCGLDAAACRGAGRLVARRPSAAFFFAATACPFDAFVVPGLARLTVRAGAGWVGFARAAAGGVAGRGVGSRGSSSPGKRETSVKRI